MSIPSLFYTAVQRDLLKLTGKDRQSFLQGMVSNDVLRLQPGEGCYAFMLDATEHVLADMHVLNIGEYLLLELEPGMAPFVAETLEKYLIMEKCRITDVTADFAHRVLGGDGAGTAVTQNFGIEDAATWKEGRNALCSPAESGSIVFAYAAGAVPLYGVIIPVASVEENALIPQDTPELSVESLEALRIEAGIPRFGVDIEKVVLAPETGQRARAISYRKGCYIGQEIVARIDARGHTNRGLVGFALASDVDTLPVRNTPVFVEGKEVGRITSAAVSLTLGTPIALGYIRNEHATPGTALTIGSAEGKSAQVAVLPFVTAHEQGVSQ